MRSSTVPEDVCAAVPAPPPAALYAVPTPVDVPVLLLNGEADPQDPPGNVAGADRLYPDSLALTNPNEGHHYPSTACEAGIIGAFVHAGAVAGLRTDCLAGTPAPPFDLG